LNTEMYVQSHTEVKVNKTRLHVDKFYC